MAGRILTTSEATDLQLSLYDGRACLDDGLSAIKSLIDSFNENEVVQTFFAAGTFGREEQEKIIKLKAIVEQEFNNLDGNLFPMTDRYLEGQKNLNERGDL